MARDILLPGIILLHVLTFTNSQPERYITTECYGSVLNLSCKRGYRIKVIDDFFGLSDGRQGADMCQYVPGDCTITNNRYSSVIHRYCEGLETCTRFQVDRRNCGANLTSYEQVEYECVPDSDVISVCSRVSLQAAEGYISTPNFPNQYLANSHCRCSLRVPDDGATVKLTFTQFIIKYDNPCTDWVEVTVSGETRRLCGAYRSSFTGSDIDLVFHSDATLGHQGFWLHFSAEPGRSAEVSVDCGPERYTTPTTTTTTTAVTPRYDHDQADYIDDIVQWNRLENRLLGKTTRTPYKHVKLPSYVNENDVIKHEANAIVAPPQTTTLSTPRPPDADDNGEKTDIKQLNKSRRHSSRSTGIIIISICVGGILLLIIILSVLLCINKRKKPKRQTLSEKKEKLQQRLCSLSFYDSIPLYDSIGHKGGVARAPPVGGDRNGNGKASDGLQCLPGSKCIPWKSDAPYWTNLHADVVDSDHDSAVYAELDKHHRDTLNDLVSPRSIPGASRSILGSIKVSGESRRSTLTTPKTTVGRGSPKSILGSPKSPVGSPRSTGSDVTMSYTVSLDTNGEVSNDDISTHV